MTNDLERLLGRDGPDIGCDACFDLLDRYVELELGGADADAEILGMRRHLDACAACNDEHDGLLELARSGPTG